MWKARLCLGTDADFGIPIEEQIRLFRQVGFDGFFTEWSEAADISGWRRLADSLHITYQSVHAPFGRADALWQEGTAAECAVEELLACLKDCAKNEIPIMVMHAFIGFGQHTPTAAGIENFKKIADAADRLGVKIALENTEGEEYLAALMEAFRGYEQVGFCWDSGHEMCYNHAQDLLAAYGCGADKDAARVPVLLRLRTSHRGRRRIHAGYRRVRDTGSSGRRVLRAGV